MREELAIVSLKLPSNPRTMEINHPSDSNYLLGGQGALFHVSEIDLVGGRLAILGFEEGTRHIPRLESSFNLFIDFGVVREPSLFPLFVPLVDLLCWGCLRSHLVRCRRKCFGCGVGVFLKKDKISEKSVFWRKYNKGAKFLSGISKGKKN